MVQSTQVTIHGHASPIGSVSPSKEFQPLKKNRKYDFVGLGNFRVWAFLLASLSIFAPADNTSPRGTHSLGAHTASQVGVLTIDEPVLLRTVLHYKG